MKKYIIIISFLFVSYITFANVDSTANILKDHVKILASDSLEGRFPGLESMKFSENYIIDNFKKDNLKQINNTYKQEFTVVTGKNIIDGNDISFETLLLKPGLPAKYAKTIKRSWTVNEDYRPMGISENGEASGEVVFAGFGITAPELNYDDYKDIDVTDKIVVLFTDTPDNDDNSDFSIYTGNQYKVSNAKKHGAKGMIFVRIEGDSMNIFFPLSYSYLGHNTGMIAVQANRHSIDKFFPKNKKLGKLEKEIRKSKTPASFAVPNVSATIKVELEDRNTPTSNIIGIVEGTDTKLKDEYIVIGAHYDHLGYGGPSSRYHGMKAKVHNGADDNASGVAGLLELASLISSHPLKRSVLFISFTAEEMGTLGSVYFVNSNLFKNLNTVAMLNMDMIGRLNKSSKELTVFGTNTSLSFSEILSKYETDDLNVKQSKQSFGASDHAPFLRDSIPALHFFTGIHGDYHTPDDDWNKLNYKGEANVVYFIYNVAKEIGDMPESIKFNTEVLTKENTSAKQHGYAKVWFGIVPSFEDTELGFKISGTSPGSPAQKAGLEKNDIITSINGNIIGNIYDFMYSIKGGKPGDKLEVEVLRGKDLTKKSFVVTLAPRN